MTRRIYRWLLRLYPSEFRERFGDEMVELAHQRRQRPFLLARDFVTGVVSAHMGARRRRSLPVKAGGFWTSIGKDFQLAFRGMRRSPGFAAVAIATIALGVGANTAIFSVVNGVVLRPLPFDEPDRLVTLWSRYTVDGRRGRMSFPDVLDLQDTVESLDAVVAYRPSALTLTGMGEPEVVPGARVATGLLETLGMDPLLGRDLLSEENVPDGPRVVMVSHRFWRERFGGRPDVLGETMTLGGEPYEIVGVAPPGFDYPEQAQLWQPLYHDVETCGRGCHNLLVVGRLVAGTTIDRLDEELSVLAVRLAEAYGDTNTGKRFSAISLNETMIGTDVRTALFVLLGAVGVVLLIASANVAHLLLARAATRTDEMAVRSALGASRFRILRQLFVESLALAGLGGLAGLLLARWALAGLVALAPETLPRLQEIALDSTVLLFASVAVFGSSILFGLTPALSISRTTLPASRQLGHHRATSRGPSTSRSILLAAEVALSLVLLFGAGLLLRSLSELRAQALGFDPDNVLTFALSLPDAHYPEPEDSVRFFEALEQMLVAIPGVDAAGSVYGSPMYRRRMSADINFLDRPAPPPGQEEGAVIRAVSPGYVDAIGVPLLRGRGIEPRDRRSGLRVAVVNESFAERFYPGRDPIGEQIGLTGSFGFEESEPRTIVGIVGNVRARNVTEPATPEVWAPQAQMASADLNVLVRASAGVRVLFPLVRSEVHRLDPNLPLRSMETLSTSVERSIGEARFYSLLLALFAGLAILLASVGLYGVASYHVSQRRREIGLRMALGAHPSDVVRLVLAQGLRPTVLGVAFGLAGALVSSRFLHSMLYNVGPLDAGSLVFATVGLLTVASAALWLPARRASLMSPTSSLRLD